MTTNKNDKTKEKRRNMLEQKENSNTNKIDNIIRENKPEGTGERKTKKTSTRGKRIQIKKNPTCK